MTVQLVKRRSCIFTSVFKISEILRNTHRENGLWIYDHAGEEIGIGVNVGRRLYICMCVYKHLLGAFMSSWITAVFQVTVHRLRNHNWCNESLKIWTSGGLHWDLHGLIFVTSLWPLAGSSRDPEHAVNPSSGPEGPGYPCVSTLINAPSILFLFLFLPSSQSFGVAYSTGTTGAPRRQDPLSERVRKPGEPIGFGQESWVRTTLPRRWRPRHGSGWSDWKTTRSLENSTFRSAAGFKPPPLLPKRLTNWGRMWFQDGDDRSLRRGPPSRGPRDQATGRQVFQGMRHSSGEEPVLITRPRWKFTWSIYLLSRTTSNLPHQQQSALVPATWSQSVHLVNFTFGNIDTFASTLQICVAYAAVRQPLPSPSRQPWVKRYLLASLVVNSSKANVSIHFFLEKEISKSELSSS